MLGLAPPLYAMERGLGGEDLSEEKQTSIMTTLLFTICLGAGRNRFLRYSAAGRATKIRNGLIASEL